MPETQIAAQLFTIRGPYQDPRGFRGEHEEDPRHGLSAVQTSKVGPIADADVKRIVDDNGLTICNTHVAFDDLLNKPRPRHRATSALGLPPRRHRGHAA